MAKSLDEIAAEERARFPSEDWCPDCGHPHLGYDDEPCVSCGCIRGLPCVKCGKRLKRVRGGDCRAKCPNCGWLYPAGDCSD